MSRSTYAVPYINPYENISPYASAKLINEGFEENVIDKETVWVKENDNFVEYIKVIYSMDVFIFSGWVKLKTDTDSYREYSLEHFKNTPAVKDCKDVLGDFYMKYAEKLKQKIVLTF